MADFEEFQEGLPARKATTSDHRDSAELVEFGVAWLAKDSKVTDVVEQVVLLSAFDY